MNREGIALIGSAGRPVYGPPLGLVFFEPGTIWRGRQNWEEDMKKALMYLAATALAISVGAANAADKKTLAVVVKGLDNAVLHRRWAMAAPSGTRSMPTRRTPASTPARR